MDMMERIGNIGFVPVVALNHSSKAVGLALALEKGGIPLIEVTYRTAQASDCIRAIRESCQNVLVGAGTVLSAAQADQAVKAGAMFIVSPGYDDATVTWCLDHGVPIIPGVSNPSEIQQAVAKGLHVLKLFPVEPLGGLSAVNFLSAPFPGLKFLPAGGILMSNLSDYLSNEHVFACAGGFVARAKMIEEEDWQGVSDLCRQAIRQMLGLEFAHVGLNCETPENASACADFFTDFMALERKDGNSSIFVDGRLELMKKPFHGRNGHLGFYTNSVERAVFRLQEKGCKIKPGTERRNSKGYLQSVYLEDEINGFAIHLVRK